jgi:hypothetical protein
MGLFSFFKKQRLRITDDVFGEMVFCKSRNPSDNFFEAQGFFPPLQTKIGLTIAADETGPTAGQKEFYHTIQSRYEEIKTAIIPLLNKELLDWYDGGQIVDFDAEFEMESIEIPRMDKKPIKWSLGYGVNRIDHWATIEFEDFEPTSVLVDG